MWEIDHQCPQCGAPVVLEETERYFSCPYCKVKLLITVQDGLSYYLGDPADNDETVYVPYRRNRGIEFTCTTLGVSGAVVDKTSLAAHLIPYPRSLGVRPQALRLRFTTKEVRGRFALPDGPVEDNHLAESRQVVLPGYAEEGIPTTVSIRRFLSEAGSFIYSPFRVVGKDMYDGLSMELIGKADQEWSFDRQLFHTPSSQTAFVPALCPNCGIDLAGDKESIALPCTNCGLLWEASGTGLSEKPFLCVPDEESGESWYLPFWRIKARAQGVETPFWIDPAKSTPPACSRRPIIFDQLHFWIPAFTVNPTFFLRLAERATMWQPAHIPSRPFEGGRSTYIYPVTLPASEAERLLPVILSLIVAQREAALVNIVRATIEPAESTLVFVPFKKTAAEVLHVEMRVSLLLNALRYGRGL
jgi:DNA-directed RNA polymerase subunit RPC12/RpoP